MKFTLLFISLLILLSLGSSAQDAKPQPPVIFRFEEELTAATQEHIALDKGKLAMADGLFSIAADYFREYRDTIAPREPEYGEASAFLAESLMGQLRLQDAVEALRIYENTTEGIQSTDERAELIKSKLAFVWGQILFLQKDFSACIERLLPLTMADAKWEFIEKATLLCTDAYIQMHDFQKALLLIQRFKETALSHHAAISFDCHQRHASILLLLGHYAEAETILKSIQPEPSNEQFALALLKITCFSLQKNIQDAFTLFRQFENYRPPEQHASFQQPSAAVWWNALWLLAQELHNQQDNERAEIILLLLADHRQLSPNDQDEIAALLLLAQTQIALGKDNLAQDSLKIIADDFPDHPNLWDVTFKLAQLKQKNRSFQTAAEIFNSLKQNDDVPKETRFLAACKQAECLLSDGQDKQAVETYIQACMWTDSIEDKADVYFRAAEITENTAKDLPEAARLYAALADQFPTSRLSSEARLRQANALFNLHDFHEAEKTFQRFAQEHPDHVMTPYAWLQQGISMKNAAITPDGARAAADFLKQKATAMENHDIASQTLLEAYQAAKKADDLPFSLDILNTILDNLHDSIHLKTATYEKIITLLEMTREAEAIVLAEEFFNNNAFAKDHYTGDIYILIADVYANKGTRDELQKAEDYYLKVLACSPSPEQAAHAVYEAAVCSCRQRKAPSRTLAILREISHNDNSDISSSERLFKFKINMLKGDLLAEDKKYDLAREAFAEAFHLTMPDEFTLKAAALGRQGEMYLQLAEEDATKVNDLESLKHAQKCFEEILSQKNISSSSSFYMTLYRLAVCFERQGDMDNAFKKYRLVCDDYNAKQRNHSDNDWLYFAKCSMKAAAIQEAQGDWVQASNIYQELASQFQHATDSRKKIMRQEALARLGAIQQHTDASRPTQTAN